jgi:hypothetical protein
MLPSDLKPQVGVDGGLGNMNLPAARFDEQASDTITDWECGCPPVG